MAKITQKTNNISLYIRFLLLKYSLNSGGVNLWLANMSYIIYRNSLLLLIYISIVLACRMNRNRNKKQDKGLYRKLVDGIFDHGVFSDKNKQVKADFVRMAVGFIFLLTLNCIWFCFPSIRNYITAGGMWVSYAYYFILTYALLIYVGFMMYHIVSYAYEKKHGNVLDYDYWLFRHCILCRKS